LAAARASAHEPVQRQTVTAKEIALTIKVDLPEG